MPEFSLSFFPFHSCLLTLSLHIFPLSLPSPLSLAISLPFNTFTLSLIYLLLSPPFHFLLPYPLYFIPLFSPLSTPHSQPFKSHLPYQLPSLFLSSPRPPPSLSAPSKGGVSYGDINATSRHDKFHLLKQITQPRSRLIIYTG